MPDIDGNKGTDDFHTYNDGHASAGLVVRETRAEREARRIGREKGKNAASWCFDGNTSNATYEATLRGLDDGDPAIYDAFRLPDLSGEMAGSYDLADLASDTDTDQDSDLFDDVCSAWESGVSEGFWDEIERVCRVQLS